MEAMLYALAAKFLDKTELRKVTEKINMALLGQLLIEDGIGKGEMIKLISLVMKKMKKGLFPEETAELPEKSPDCVSRIYAAVQANPRLFISLFISPFISFHRHHKPFPVILHIIPVPVLFRLGIPHLTAPDSQPPGRLIGIYVHGYFRRISHVIAEPHITEFIVDTCFNHFPGICLLIPNVQLIRYNSHVFCPLSIPGGRYGIPHRHAPSPLQIYAKGHQNQRCPHQSFSHFHHTPTCIIIHIVL